MALADNALVDLDTELKPYLGIDASDTDYDLRLEALINSVSQLVQTYLGRTLISTAYVDQVLNGRPSVYLFLPSWPVTEWTSVEIDSAEVTETLTEDTDYVVDMARGVLERIDGSDWDTGMQSIVVNYTAGYALADVPQDIKLLVMARVGAEWQRQKSALWGQTSRGVEGGSASFEFSADLTDAEKAMLNRYRRILA